MNAKEELKCFIKDDEVLCWHIFDNDMDSILKVGYTPEDMERELNKLNFEYDEGYGGQILFGTVIFKDGSWLERGEYDGSEWWEYKRTPKLPECL